MGSFITNVQVKTRDADRVLQVVSDATGYRPAAEGEAADRTIVVRCAGEWTSVYDELTESQDDRILDSLAITLSRQLETRALTVLVHDSDVLLLSLFERGERLARYDSNPRFSGKKPKKQPIEPWLSLLAEGRTRDELGALLGAEEVFAETTLAKLAALFGLPVDNAVVGYRYHERAPGDRVAKLRLIERPAYEKTAEGPARFEMGGHSQSLELSVGTPAPGGWSVRNAGGPAKGLDVVVAGAAIEKGLVRALEVELLVGAPQQAARLTAKVDRGVARFADVAIPAGTAMTGLAPGMDAHKLVEAMYGSNVHANVQLEALRVGDAELVIGFVPHGAPDEGQYGYTCRLSCVAASRRPLRAHPNVDATQLRELDRRTHLFAVASSALPRAEAAAVAIELIPRWGELFGSDGQLALAVFKSRPGAAPGSGAPKAKGFFTSARWKKLRSELEAEALVTADHQLGDGLPGRGGFAFGQGILPMGRDVLPTFGLWLSTDGCADIAGARERLIELVDAFMQRADGTQAFIAPWRGPPSLDHTPYEAACGVGGVSLLRGWQTRWLRAVTDDWLWLGPALLARVTDRAQLEQVGELHTSGRVTRVRARSSLDALEQALAEVLPGHEDWMKGSAELLVVR